MNLFSSKYIRWTWYFLFSLISILSFYFYSYVRLPALNSDHAVTILMAHDFHFPQNLYFWGQDRYGSLVPLLAQPLVYIGIAAIWATSIVHYSILICGFMAALQFIQRPLLKVCLAVIWFFPPARLIDWLEFYTGITYSLLFIGMYSVQFYRPKYKSNTLNQLIPIAIAYLCFFLAVWVCDVAIISVAIFIGTQAFFILKSNAKPSNFFTVKVKITYLLHLIGFIFGIWLIHLVKSQAVRRIDYSLLLKWADLDNTWAILASTLGSFFSFNANEIFTSIYIYLISIILIIILIKNICFIKGSIFKNVYLVYFGADAVLVTFVLMCCQFTLDNNVPRRYFTFFYISAFMFLLVLLDKSGKSNKIAKRLPYLLLFSLCLAGFGGIYNFNFVWPRHIEPRATYIKELDKLGKCGIVGDYWNSYVNMCLSPENILATPYMFEQIRNPGLFDSTFNQPKIYLIKDMWMDNFSETVFVQSKVLLKHGNEFYLAKSHMCEYELQRTH